MSTYTTPATHHIHPDRVILALLALFGVIAVATGARVTWDVPRFDTADPAPTVSAAAVERAAVVASAAGELDALRQTVREVPATQAVFADRIELLRLVTAGTLPVEAAVAIPSTSVAVQQVDHDREAAVIDARRDLAGLRDVVRSSPSIGDAMAEELATLDAVGRGFVPPETLGD